MAGVFKIAKILLGYIGFKLAWSIKTENRQGILALEIMIYKNEKGPGCVSRALLIFIQPQALGYYVGLLS
ncbi:hypothetical protein DF182_09615 [Chitinophaga flava]|uniref:Uncharacterized protein n=1 Tax=Chitinophaga flava TaxID=2259036 RepID=A0A365Y493_9BACT|nr:hypothetical protein DF182_09615 [Chitinophaga flava]